MKYYRLIIFFLLVCAGLLTVMFYSASKMLYYSDLSEHIPKQISKKLNKTYLVTYASGSPLFIAGQKFLAYSAIKHNIQHILNYNEADINSEFYDKNKDILNVKLGGGLWLWKPYIIQKTLSLVPENSYVIYADSGVIFYKDITPLLELAKKHQMVLSIDADSVDPNPHDILGTIASKGILRKTNCDNLECRKSPHVWAGFGIFKNTPKVRKFVDKWLAYCEDYDLIAGKNFSSKLEQYPEYIIHKHDQTLLNITNFQENIGQYILPLSEWRNYAINIHRRRRLEPSLLPIQLYEEKIIRGTFRNIYQHPIMVRIRQFLFKSSK